jgi:hypothetical protein
MVNNDSISKAVIEIDKQYGTSITTFRESGTHSKKGSTIEDVQRILLENFQFATGWLPAGTRYYRRGNDLETVLIESPPIIRGVEYRGNAPTNSKFTIPLPWTLWKFSITDQQGKRRLAESMVYAMKTPIVPGREADHQLYRFPFSNVSSGICWGGGSENSNAMNTLTNVSYLGRMIEQFWSAPFNGDLDGGKYTPFANDNGTTVSYCHGLLEHLDGKTSFPYDILIAERTLGSLI